MLKRHAALAIDPRGSPRPRGTPERGEPLDDARGQSRAGPGSTAPPRAGGPRRVTALQGRVSGHAVATGLPRAVHAADRARTTRLVARDRSGSFKMYAFKMEL